MLLQIATKAVRKFGTFSLLAFTAVYNMFPLEKFFSRNITMKWDRLLLFIICLDYIK